MGSTDDLGVSGGRLSWSYERSSIRKGTFKKRIGLKIGCELKAGAIRE